MADEIVEIQSQQVQIHHVPGIDFTQPIEPAATAQALYFVRLQKTYRI